MPAFRPLQLIPPGLLGLLQLKQEGRGLVELPDVLQGVIELRDWYLQARSEWSLTTHSGVINATGRANFLTFANPVAVPEQEWWFVHQYVVKADPVPGAGSAEVHSLVPVMIQQATGTARSVAIGSGQFPVGANTAAHTVWAEGRDFFAPAGARLGLAYGVTVAGGGTVNVDAFIRYTPLPI